MKKYDVMLFDLDGTLTDPGIGITNSVAYALRKFDIDVPDRIELYKFIGPPLLDSFHGFYGFSEEESRLALKYYREYFAETGIFENELYPGVPEMLEGLKAAGIQIGLATSKPEPYARRILDHFSLSRFFDSVTGASMDEVLSRKPDIIALAVKKHAFQDLSKVIMVGDREHDVLGASENHIQTIGVLYGYGSKEELQTAGAVWLAEKPNDILKICLS